MLAGMGTRVLQATATLLLASPLAWLAGCGSSDDAQDPAAAGSAGSTPSAVQSQSDPGMATSPSAATPSSSPAPASWSGCGTVWKDGATLPRAYRGCADAGAAVPAHHVGCESGQSIVTYAEHFFAVPGGRITRTEQVLKNSPAYAASIATCRG